MPHEWQDEEEEDDFDEDVYDPDDPETYPDGVYADPELPTIACPHCGEEILEESQRCPSCGKYLSEEDVSKQSRSRPWLIVTILALLSVLLWIFVRG